MGEGNHQNKGTCLWLLVRIAWELSNVPMPRTHPRPTSSEALGWGLGGGIWKVPQLILPCRGKSRKQLCGCDSRRRPRTADFGRPWPRGHFPREAIGGGAVDSLETCPWERLILGHMLGSRKRGRRGMSFRLSSIWAGQPSLSPLPFPTPPWPRIFFPAPSGSSQLPLTCEQAGPTDLQLEVELVFHGVGHIGIQESRQAQFVPGVQGLGVEAMLVFAGKGAERRRRRPVRAEAGGQQEKTWRKRQVPGSPGTPAAPLTKGLRSFLPPQILTFPLSLTAGRAWIQVGTTTYDGWARHQAWGLTLFSPRPQRAASEPSPPPPPTWGNRGSAR